MVHNNISSKKYGTNDQRQPTSPLLLTQFDSNVLKGLALLFLLTHHLFYIRNGLFDDFEIYKDHYLVNMIGQTCKVCVPLFVFLSGYGLTVGAEKLETINFKNFYIRRFSKLYLNYWLIWLLFVPVGIFLFGITFDKVYGKDFEGYLILDLLGLINFTGKYGYNPTWWFYSCISALYIFFPFIITECKRKWVAHIILWISVAIVFCPFEIIRPFRFYLLTFILGCYFRNGLIINILPPPIRSVGIRVIQGDLTFWESLILFSLTIISIPMRFLAPYSLVFDTIIAILMVVTYKNIKLNQHLTRSLAFCGRHSFNIFLFHTFLYFLYIPQIIYWHHNPLIIFITLIALCITLSVSIEYLKDISGFNKLYYKIIK